MDRKPADVSSPLVSIVMPTYNQDQFIGESIRSVLDQTHSNWELIIVNNFSEDDTINVVENFNDDRIRLINFKNNGIIAASRNIGILECKGEFVAFLDSDDIWLPEKLRIQIEYFKKNPKIGLLSTNATVIPGDTKLHKINSNRKISTRELFLKSVIVNSSVLMRHSIIEEIGLLDENPDIRAAEDLDYWIRASLKMEVAIIKKCLTLYRVHSSNASELGNNSSDSIKKFFNLYLRVLKKYEDNYKLKKFAHKFKRTYGARVASAELNEKFRSEPSYILKVITSKALIRTKIKIVVRFISRHVGLPQSYFIKN